MTIVLDASAAIEIILKREKSTDLRKKVEISEKVITSDLYKIEIANVLWKYCKADLLVKNDANKILFLAENLIDEFIDISENNNESLNEAIRLNHSTYDMLYFTLARRTGATLMTLDSRLNSLAKKEGIDIVEV